MVFPSLECAFCCIAAVAVWGHPLKVNIVFFNAFWDLESIRYQECVYWVHIGSLWVCCGFFARLLWWRFLGDRVVVQWGLHWNRSYIRPWRGCFLVMIVLRIVLFDLLRSFVSCIVTNRLCVWVFFMFIFLRRSYVDVCWSRYYFRWLCVFLVHA